MKKEHTMAGLTRRMVTMLQNGINGGNPIGKLNPSKKEKKTVFKKKPETKTTPLAEGTEPKPAPATVPTPAPVPEPAADKAPVQAAAPATIPTPAPEKPKRLTALEQLRKAREAMQTGNILDQIEEASQVKNDPYSIEDFLKAVDAADAYAMTKAGQLDSCPDWESLSLAEIESQLAKWAETADGAVIGPIVATLSVFNKLTVSVSGPYWRIANDVLRPARDVASYRDLNQFIGQLKDRRLVVVIVAKRFSDAERKLAVILRWNEEVGVLPAKNEPLISKVWPWIKKAEARAKEALAQRTEYLRQLEGSATCKTFSQACACEIGTFFLRTGEGQGGLLETHTNGAGTSFRIVEVVGLPRRLENPNCWIRMEAKRTVWPSETAEFFFEAFWAWRKKG